jgi:hypothetical protein
MIDNIDASVAHHPFAERAIARTVSECGAKGSTVWRPIVAPTYGTMRRQIDEADRLAPHKANCRTNP